MIRRLARPPRLTFADICIWCGQFGCTDSECVASHNDSTWRICPDCRGTAPGWCMCAYGLVPTTSAVPDRPAWAPLESGWAR
ncbi:hypothetical protein ACIRRA_24040 [Nocardia sp. NPDC101769]|uniref:hypothetical protein n=1 Tax=Nocardia sp. NPDC101769 TaxID=3364333 RepID=UPI0038096508